MPARSLFEDNRGRPGITKRATMSQSLKINRNGCYSSTSSSRFIPVRSLIILLDNGGSPDLS